jgi:hypothetical protein
MKMLRKAYGKLVSVISCISFHVGVELVESLCLESVSP